MAVIHKWTKELKQRHHHVHMLYHLVRLKSNRIIIIIIIINNNIISNNNHTNRNNYITEYIKCNNRLRQTWLAPLHKRVIQAHKL